MKILSKAIAMRMDVKVGDLAHGYRVAELTYKIARKAGLPDDEIKNIYAAAMLHDMGKSSIDTSISEKPGKLSIDEKKMMNLHVEYGVKVGIHMNLLQDNLKYMLAHHENFDGSGYPTGTGYEGIPIGARIIRICDVYDALISERVYRTAYPVNKAIAIMQNEKSLYDPNLFDLFLEVVKVESK